MIISVKDKMYQHVYNEFTENKTNTGLDNKVQLDFERGFVTTTWLTVLVLIKEAGYSVSLINVAMICDPMREFCTKSGIPVVYKSAYGTSKVQ